MLECDPVTQRKAVLDRDGGVCAMCGTDTVMLLSSIKLFLYREVSREEMMRAMGFKFVYGTLHTTWEMDHIKPLVMGGSSDMENLRTLCVPCHKKETAELNRRSKVRVSHE
ncbi:MAG: HNH endonuclease [FCB group bacterium]|nr:HNH endonuclease [FCB group bacterium]